MDLRKLTWSMFAAAAIIIVLIVYSSFQCRVNRDQFSVSPFKPFVVIAATGYAVGFTFNITNLSGCDVTVQSIDVTLRNVTYIDGTQTAGGLTESSSQLTTLTPHQATHLGFTFTSYFDLRPVKLNLKVEIGLGGSGEITVFDGEINYPS